ncbi:MAG TPA: hypothetical protein VMW38_17360 [Terriglobia bacterium]|nr:hypothetical protein [Terriglobia bacterium]
MLASDFSGVWRLNLAQSDIPDVTKSQTLTIETNGSWVRMREELLNNKGETLIITVDGNFDGQDYPVKGTPFADTVAYRLLDQRTIEGIAKKGGKVIVKETAVLSESSNTVHVTYLSVDDQGNTTTSFGIFERV